ncbi:MAG: class I SAM-dependent methyltransferase [Oligoflexia bacterium]|nr:class I SAM-dependent methyltransferase [Oligoflexia bacterium]
MNEYKTIKHCRSCHNPDLELIKDMGMHYVSNFPEKENHEEFPHAPLVLVFCPHCKLLQLEHTAPQELLYRQFYWYRSGVTQSMKDALRDITKEIEELGILEDKDIVLDIGSNDGTLIRTYTQSNIIKVGVEPAKNLAKEGAQGCDIFINDFWTKENYQNFCNSKAKIITAIGMFYDLEDPNKFISDISDCLSDDGVFIAQLMCNKNMLQTIDLGNINHEHLEYYSLDSLNYLFEKYQLEIFDIKTNKVNNESYRIFIKKKDGTYPVSELAKQRVQDAFIEDRQYNTKEAFEKFFQEVDKAKEECLQFIKKANEEGKSVWVYGASTKGNTILQYYGLDHKLIQKAAERSPEKYGKYTIGTKIPIVSEDEARKASPDYFLVLPYTFINEMYEREKDWRDQGGKFLVPLPEFKVLS